MLYHHKKKLTAEEFKNPSSEYRGAPFWAWNCYPDKETLMKQIEVFKEMGFGGFIIHSREGMAVPYLKSEFMQMVQMCVDKAKNEGIKAWLYDEDRWPSGSAGGYVTKNPKYRRKLLRFTKKKNDGKLISSYNVVLDSDGNLSDYTMNENGNNVWYAYLEEAESESRFNGYTDVDVMKPEAIDAFIKETHEKYKSVVGGEFSKTVPAIFTDEPQTVHKKMLKTPSSEEDILLPWTDDFADTFYKEYKFDIIEFLPEIVWELSDCKASRARYCYHNHSCDRFLDNFCGKCGEWCEANNLIYTGHLLQEETLFSQTEVTGDVMRGYKYFQLPGMDLLCNNLEYSTAKQTQSVVRQYGREGMISEMYGVTNWDFDFRGHKFQGDWQAAMGVTVRVPHLTWMSMKGSAKRDYPASIGMHSPWYKEYSYVENHFARINTALTKGKAVARIGVIHPIESYWLHWGPKNQTEAVRAEKQEEFDKITEWLLFGLQDFDFINEALLAKDSEVVDNMNYQVIIVPHCENLRGTTLDYLEKFMAQGKKVLIMGSKPRYIDVSDVNADSILSQAQIIPFERDVLLRELEEYRLIDITDNDERSKNLIYQLREDNDEKWLFVAKAKKPENKENLLPQNIMLKITGQYEPIHYDTQTGKILPLSFTYKNGKTCVPYELYDCESLLINLKNTDETERVAVKQSKTVISTHTLELNAIEREELNVLLLDNAEYAFMNEEYSAAEEVLRIDTVCRKKAQLPPAYLKDIQPWCDTDKASWNNKRVSLKFYIESEDEIDNISLALEDAVEIEFNDEKIDADVTGWYVDPSIKTVKLPQIKKGKNVLCVKIPFGRRAGVEPMYLLGDFEVRTEGSKCKIYKKCSVAKYGTVTDKGMPFYGGNLIYRTELDIKNDCFADICVPSYIGSLVKVFIDGKDVGNIVYAPNSITAEMSVGKHRIKFVLYGNRHNTFGSLHNCGDCIFYGPHYWRGEGKDWTYDYLVKDFGIMKAPTVTLWK